MFFMLWFVKEIFMYYFTTLDIWAIFGQFWSMFKGNIWVCSCVSTYHVLCVFLPQGSPGPSGLQGPLGPSGPRGYEVNMTAMILLFLSPFLIQQ